MTRIQNNLTAIHATLPPSVQLVTVSKFHPEEEIMEAYEVGERDFAESHVQELLRKQQALPQDIRWHMIGHLQTNKVKHIVPFIHLIQSVDSLHLMDVIEKEASRINRVIPILLEVHVAREENKTGLSLTDLDKAISRLNQYPHLRIDGIMGMATLTDNEEEIRRCFRDIRTAADKLPNEHPIVSMGMSHDYLTAVDEGSTMVRIGTTIFGNRHY